MSNTSNPQLEKILRNLHEQITGQDGAIRQKDMSSYTTLMAHYRKVPDSIMQYVFAEFQRTTSLNIRTNIPHKTPEQMRDYLAKIHTCLGSSL